MARALNGRKIFIDPGHGGPFTGMVAPSNGIHEADVNLNVSLKLRDKLQAQGATVLMSHVDNSVPVPDNASRDLSERAALSNAAKPDVFISIHHNADIEAGSQRDDLEVYYKRGDSMASLDLGRSLISALGRGIRYNAVNKRLLPGNYKVLRLSEVPALLLETAYLTNNQDAAYLATDRGVEDEADSILYGLASYFALDPPNATEEREHPVIDSLEAQQFSTRFSRGTPIDVDTVSIYRDGDVIDAAVTATRDGFDWTLRGPLPNGVATYEIVGRNTLGAGFSVRRTVNVGRAASAVTVTQRPSVAASGNRVLFEVRVSDAAGKPVANGTQVAVRGRAEAVETVDGIANFYFHADELPETISFICEGMTNTFSPTLGEQRHQTIVTYDSVSGEPIAGAIVSTDRKLVGITNADGWIALPLNGGPFRVRQNGYEEMSLTISGSGHAIAAIRALHGGALIGRRIAIDPAHGGRVPGVVAPDGARASDLNFEVAQRLARLLERSGAQTLLTRTGDHEITDLRRIDLTEPFAADVLLTISFGAPVEQTRPLDPVGHLRRDLSAFVGHYPQSVNGIRAATAIGEELGVPKTACVSYMVQQSQSAAVHVQPASLNVQSSSPPRYDATTLRDIAQSIHKGLITYFTEMDND